MFEYDTQIMRTAKNYNIQERDVIFAHLIAAGIQRADAYYTLYNRGKNNGKADRKKEDTNAAELISNNPGLKVLIHKIKMQAPINTNNTQKEVKTLAAMEEESEEAKELQTRQGLTKKLRQEIAEIHGKDSVQGLIQLAKLEGYDKEDNRQEEEKRRYFLPYRTKCRACNLLKLFKTIQDEKEREPEK